MKFYLVGGAVRDRLLGLQPDERDWVVVGATADELVSLGFRRLDAEFPVFAHPQSGEQYALARRERKTGPGHKGFVVEYGPDVSLEEDLLRRDLRLNAIAESESGRLIDPYGGQADIESRLLRHVSPAFVDDPLRVFRAARFAARFDSLGFTIHPSTLELMRSMSRADEMGALSPARIWSETEKALVTDSPARYFTELAGCGAIGLLLPGFDLEASTRDATSPVRQCAVDALEAAAARDGRTGVRFAALAAALDATGDSAALDRICRRYPVPRKHADLARIAIRLRSDLGSGSASRANGLLAAMKQADAFRRPKRFNDALLVCRAVASAADDSSGAIDALERAHSAAREVSGAELFDAGLEGEDLARELELRRLTAIEKSLAAPGKRGR